MAARTTRTDKDKKSVFLLALCRGTSISLACTKALLPRRTVYDWRDADEKFRVAWDEAIEAGTERLEDEAYRRAHDGVKKPIFHKGKRVAFVQEYSDTLLMFLMKGRKPDKYRDNSKVEVSGTLTLEQLVLAAEKVSDQAKTKGAAK